MQQKPRLYKGVDLLSRRETDPQYRKRWEDKKKFYEKNGIVEGKNLIVTYDDDNGGIDTELIEKIIKDTFDED